jgi:hypothetical protein
MRQTLVVNARKNRGDAIDCVGPTVRAGTLMMHLNRVFALPVAHPAGMAPGHIGTITIAEICILVASTNESDAFRDCGSSKSPIMLQCQSLQRGIMSSRKLGEQKAVMFGMVLLLDSIERSEPGCGS